MSDTQCFEDIRDKKYFRNRRYPARECYADLLMYTCMVPLQRLITLKQTATAVNGSEIRRLNVNESAFKSYKGIFNHITGREVSKTKSARIIGYRSLMHGGYCLVPIAMGTYLSKKLTQGLTQNRHIDIFNQAVVTNILTYPFLMIMISM